MPDPLAEKRSWVSPFCYVQNNPINRTDLFGMLDTKYEDEQGNTLLETNDGSDAVVTVTDDKRAGFDASVKGTENTDDPTWNNTMKKYLVGFELSDQQEGVLSMLNSEWSKKHAIEYWQNPTAGNAFSFAFSEVLSQWTNPELVVMGLSVGIAGMGAVEGISTTTATKAGASLVDDAAYNAKAWLGQDYSKITTIS